MAAHLCVLACGRLAMPFCFKRRLHLRDVPLHLVEVDAQRRRIELPFRHARADRPVHAVGGPAHLGSRVALRPALGIHRYADAAAEVERKVRRDVTGRSLMAGSNA